MRDVVIVEAGRSPIGKRGGSFADVHPADVLGPVQMEVVRRAGIESGDVGQVVGGCINKVGAQAMNITRTARRPAEPDRLRPARSGRRISHAA